MKRISLITALIFMSALCLASCGKTVGVGEGSPVLESASIVSYCQGSEQEQYVQAELMFDRPISLAEETGGSLRITIAGNRMEDYTISPGEGENCAVITIPVNAVTESVLYIGKATGADSISDIRSGDGKYAARDFELEGVIPSGVTLSTVSSEPGKVVKNVESGWNIRSIAWVGLRENGQPVAVSETMPGEELDGYAAVHGHEFLIEDEADIAEKIVEVLEKNYGTEYSFSFDGTLVTAEKPGSTAALDVCVYQYIMINGNKVELLAEVGPYEEPGEEQHEDEHELGQKYKTADEDREVSEDEQALLNLLRSQRLTDAEIQEATELFYTFTITGEALSEAQIYPIKDLEELLRLSYVNSSMNSLGLPATVSGYYGLEFGTLLELSGVDTGDSELNILCESDDGSRITLRLSDLVQEGVRCVLAFSDEAGPLDFYGVGEGPVCLVVEDQGTVKKYTNLFRMTIGYGEEPADPQYGYHNYGPYLESRDIAFTVEVYQSGAEYLGALKTVSFTTEELEEMMRQHPEAVVRGFYGTIGNEEHFRYIGVGGWLDCFEGLDFYWLLTEKVGLSTFSGRAELYDRDGLLYTEIDDLGYFSQAHERAEEYYVMSAAGLKITGMIPMLATVKNGAPILPNHTHDGEDYIAYNTLNQSLEAAGVSTEVGVVKNHNGPFIACLGNRSGYYGGPEVETGNNCVTLRLYLK